MGSGKAFEILIRTILHGVGFMDIISDGIYIFDGSAGQMIQGLGEAHNADVLVEPPVQIPFNTPARLLVECKNYYGKVGLGTLRSALGLKEDVNNFEIVDMNVLMNRKANKRAGITYSYTRHFYQIAVASMNGFTIPAQEFALTHRITLIDFSMMPFWNEYLNLIITPSALLEGNFNGVKELAERIGKNMAIGVLNCGQLLFLYKKNPNNNIYFDDHYTLHWENINSLWTLRTGNNEYLFSLPNLIQKQWISNSSEDTLKENAIVCKQDFMSSIVVYYVNDCKSCIKMISIDKDSLRNAKNALNIRE